MSDNLKGAIWMMLSMLAFTINDTAMKAASDVLPLGQQVFLRGLAVCMILAVVVVATGAHRVPIPRTDWRRIVIRSLAEVGAAYFFLTALFNMPIANATAILLLLPLCVSLAAYFFLGEYLGWRRLTAIAIGFCGVLLIVKPGTEGFNWATIYGLIAVAFVTLRDLITRKMTKAVPSVMITFMVAIFVTVGFGLYALGEDWVRPRAYEVGLMSIAVVAVCAGYFLSVIVMRVGEVTFVAGFRYSSLLFSMGLGFVFFDEWPDIWTILGAAIIVLAGLFMLWRKRQIAQDGGTAP